MAKSWRKRLGELLQLREPALMFPIWAMNERHRVWLVSVNSSSAVPQVRPTCPQCQESWNSGALGHGECWTSGRGD